MIGPPTKTNCIIMMMVDEWMMIMPALLGTLGFLSATTLLHSCFII
jgi:hypothetical protein